ncbi:hypothetical protein, conserved [Entamoeba dispar SAW760]|uniref:Uncharacterized protein n=1 Tax=Entamoeba dispar (strain ATCC PRA-260 / SAW760) TaxID=370354 RepID=B0EEZ3_ENTDS|nr:uncharacterized protein EDI_126610 [Entamoeba dispar SAW760]EDR26910.1 hypothetical protein, conserved [Entamoeba dispar SAW760]|eukprot:EDR26910.1 hypothetical protein, conserved [Entamoeba dispar SAW760]
MFQRNLTITCCGDGETGKTAFIKTLLHQKHDQFHISTLDEEYFYDLVMGSKTYKLKILDSPGNQEYRGMIEYDVKDSDGIILFFDTTIGPSFVDLEEYYECFDRAVMGFDLPVILVGNLHEDKQPSVRQEMIDEFCKKHSCEYFPLNCVKDEQKCIEALTELYKKMDKLN